MGILSRIRAGNRTVAPERADAAFIIISQSLLLKLITDAGTVVDGGGVVEGCSGVLTGRGV